MAILIALGIAMAVVAYVATPFFLGHGKARRDGADDGQVPAELLDLLAEKETVYAAIQELDFDLQSGKLSAEDHQTLRQRQEERAAVLLQQIDILTGAAGRTEASHKTRREKRRR